MSQGSSICVIFSQKKKFCENLVSYDVRHMKDFVTFSQTNYSYENLAPRDEQHVGDFFIFSKFCDILCEIFVKIF